jgi:hypothetical protein
VQKYIVFREYSEKKRNKIIIKKSCNYCNWTTVKNATRQLNHILDCCKCPKNIKDVFKSDATYSTDISMWNKF